MRPGRGFWVPTEDMKHKQLLNDVFPLVFTIYSAIRWWYSFALYMFFMRVGQGVTMSLYVVSKAQERGGSCEEKKR